MSKKSLRDSTAGVNLFDSIDSHFLNSWFPTKDSWDDHYEHIMYEPIIRSELLGSTEAMGYSWLAMPILAWGLWLSWANQHWPWESSPSSSTCYVHLIIFQVISGTPDSFFLPCFFEHFLHLPTMHKHPGLCADPRIWVPLRASQLCWLVYVHPMN